MTIFLGFVKMSGVLCMGDNPFTHFYPAYEKGKFPTFYHRFVAGYSVKTTFFPLLIV
jgi:hypothetical protein